MSRSLTKEKGMASRAFLLALGMAVLLFLPFVIYDRGYFTYYGDFNAQQIPFYQMAHDAVRSGRFGWNWLTDLGANFIGSYSFYLLGSPFFWLTIPFPSAAVPYLMAPLLALKMACASLTAYAYARRFLQPRMAVVAGLLYAFSGFSLYNIFFNHFHEAMIWFPLLLLGIEQQMQERRRGLFAVAVLMSALSNYYFFIGQALFVMIYWVVRASSGAWEQRTRGFFTLWLEALLGVAGAAVLLLPSFYSVIQNSRSSEYLEGFGFLIYGTSQRLYDILHSFLFPPELPARANFFPEANNKWASMSAWIPVFGCTGVIAYFQSRRHTDWLRRMLVVLFFCAVIPGLNAMFQLFNQMYYARWYYMMVLMLILATLSCFDGEQPVEWGRAIGWAGGWTAAFAVLIGLLPKSWTPDEETGKLQWGLEKYPEMFWIYVAVACLCLVLTGLLAYQWKRDRRRFVGWCTAVCAAVSLLFGWSYMAAGKSIGNYPDEYVIDKLIEGGDFVLPDTETFSRVDMHKGMDNQGMYWQMPCIQAFHSIVPGSVMDFYESVGVSRSVGSRPDSSAYALRSLLSVRWLFDYVPDEGDVELYNKKPEDAFSVEGEDAMPGWTYRDKQQGFRIYENDGFIPMGFTYEGYITRSEYEEQAEDIRQFLLLKALVVEDEDAAAVPLPHLDPYDMLCTDGEYRQDCADRAAGAASDFTVDTAGFTATITLPESNWVFFSVPYESGWSATVNGQPAEVRQVNVGFMAVACPAGESVTIRFDYETPGLRVGLCVCAVGLVLLAVYLIVGAAGAKRRAGRTEPLLPPEPPTLPPVCHRPGDFDLYSIYHPEE